MEQKFKKESKGTLLDAFFGFVLRSAKGIGLVFIKALFQGFVLAYPLKWLWNDLAVKLGLKGVTLLTYWTALFMLVLFLFITKLIEARKVKKETLED